VDAPRSRSGPGSAGRPRIAHLGDPGAVQAARNGEEHVGRRPRARTAPASQRMASSAMPHGGQVGRTSGPAAFGHDLRELLYSRMG
jgi:hypothetical protein